jgi:quercetin dioxygenase-like cupin family protein
MHQLSIVILRSTMLLLAFLPGLVSAELAVTEILKTNKSWNGDTFSYLAGTPEVTTLFLSMDEGDETGFHCHPVPVFGYILEGELHVESDSGKTEILRKGDATVETMNKLHNGHAVGGPVQLVAFFAGVEATPNSLTQEQVQENPESCTQ